MRNKTSKVLGKGHDATLVTFLSQLAREEDEGQAIRRLDSSTTDDVGIAESKTVSVLADHFNYR